MIPFTQLNVGFSNAENYKRRENKELLNRYFVRDHYLERLLDSNIFFLVGEKGTGKTAYATYLRNNEYKNYHVTTYDVRQTEYHKFLELKRRGHLELSSYTEVWRTLLLMTCATSILDGTATPEFLKKFTKFEALSNAIEDFYDDAFVPEIVKMLNFVESADVTASLVAKYLGIESKVGSDIKSEVRDSKAVFQLGLLKLRKAFEAVLSGLKLDKNELIFIDGIDVRPSDIAYDDYFDCVRGLIEAVWSINNDFLSNIKASTGRMRIVLLVRPDIFLRTGLHNLNTKLRDNSVFLNWATTYKDYRGSLLFRVADRLLSAQQQEPSHKLGHSWDHYFPFHAENVGDQDVASEDNVNSFLAFLRFSYYRPRDITAMIGTMQDIVKKNKDFSEYVNAEDFDDPSFRDAHAEYLLGEIRDQLLFYYSQDEYDLFLQFFSHLRGNRKFSYRQFESSFNEFIAECVEAGKQLPQFFESANVFLQFLYEQNVICYIEKDAAEKERRGGKIDKKSFIRWCFRERTLSNMAPKVRTHVQYEIFYGLSKALNVGRPVKVNVEAPANHIGTVASLREDGMYGFIHAGEAQTDYYFKFSDVIGDVSLLRVGQKVFFSPKVKYGNLRATAVRRVPRTKTS